MSSKPFTNIPKPPNQSGESNDSPILSRKKIGESRPRATTTPKTKSKAEEWDFSMIDPNHIPPPKSNEEAFLRAIFSLSMDHKYETVHPLLSQLNGQIVSCTAVIPGFCDDFAAALRNSKKK